MTLKFFVWWSFWVSVAAGMVGYACGAFAGVNAMSAAIMAGLR